MDFESIKEQLIERFNSYRSQIEDNELYIRAKEGYENLTPNIQKLIKYGSLVIVVYIVYSIPASFVSSANEKLTFFEENRQLTRELIRAGRVAKTIRLPPPAPSSSQLTSQVQSILDRERVLPEQKIATSPMEDVASKVLVPKSIKQSGIKTSIKKLNLKQVVRIGEALGGINSSQLMNMVMQADSKDPHYYNVDYEVAAFSVPQSDLAMAADDAGKDKKSKDNKKKRGKSRFGGKKNKKDK